MADKSIKKEKKTPKKSNSQGIASAAMPRPIMPQPEIIKKKKKDK